MSATISRGTACWSPWVRIGHFIYLSVPCGTLSIRGLGNVGVPYLILKADDAKSMITQPEGIFPKHDHIVVHFVGDSVSNASSDGFFHRIIRYRDRVWSLGYAHDGEARCLVPWKDQVQFIAYRIP